MTSKTITLGGQPYELTTPPIGRLRKLVPAITGFSMAAHRMAQTSALSEEDLGHAVTALAAGLGKTEAEVEQIPATLPELLDAIPVLAEVAGLAAKGEQPGEPQPGKTPATDSTPSTA
jgi:hypothetical protein